MNKGEFRSRPISAFVDIFALSQSERVNRYFVNKDGYRYILYSSALLPLES